MHAQANRSRSTNYLKKYLQQGTSLYHKTKVNDILYKVNHRKDFIMICHNVKAMRSTASTHVL